MIHRGHAFNNLHGVYTMDQVERFYEAAHRNLKKETLLLSVAMRVGFGANKKQWQEYISDLEPKSKGKKLSKKEYDGLRKLHRRLTRGR